MTKTAATAAPILSPLAERWSPRAFTEAKIPEEKLIALFEAARWAPSAYNVQPWAFVTATAGSEGFDKILESLVEFNRGWAKAAPVLVVSFAQVTKPDGKPNSTAAYDLGQAVANLATQATAEGLYIHQMSGFDPAKAAELLGAPAGWEAVTAFALGEKGDPASLSGGLAERETAARERKPLSEFVFDGSWPA